MLFSSMKIPLHIYSHKAAVSIIPEFCKPYEIKCLSFYFSTTASAKPTKTH